ncbi:MAG TPA: ABC transporter permease [Bradyrhizobium sp.]
MTDVVADNSATPAATPILAATRIMNATRRWLLTWLRDPLLCFATMLLIGAVAIAFAANLIYPTDPLDMVAPALLWPGQDWDYPLGTDSLGRDLAAGIVHGARVSLLVGSFAALIGLVIGTTIGALAGYFGGIIDNILVRLTELFQTIPAILLVIVILAIGDPSIFLIVLSIGLASWPMIARLARSQFMTLRDADFVMAARGLGYGTTRIIVGEILPNALPTLVVATSVLVANGILAEAGLSFLNLGDPNRVSWGSLIGSGRTMLRSEWYLTALPGLAIVLTVLSINIIGDRLTDILNPRSETR